MQLANETIVSLEVAPLKFGVGATEEVGYDLKRLGVTRALIITDRHIKATGLTDRVQKLIKEEGITSDISRRKPPTASTCDRGRGPRAQLLR